MIEVIGERDGGVQAVRLRDTVSGGETLYPTQGVFVAIGHQPNTEVFRGSCP